MFLIIKISIQAPIIINRFYFVDFSKKKGHSYAGKSTRMTNMSESSMSASTAGVKAEIKRPNTITMVTNTAAAVNNHGLEHQHSEHL